LKKKQIFTNYILLGGNSRIASAFYQQVDENRVFTVDRELYNQKALENNLEDLFHFLIKFSNTKTLVLIFAGITDSNSNLLDQINYLMPLEIIKWCDSYSISTATFGTVMENKDVKNPYVISKKKLFDFLFKNKYYRHFHFQLNTIYGNELPPSNMFLGEIADCLKHKTSFNMSSGLQYREYQSNTDCINKCLTFINTENYGIKEITFNENFKLIELAEYIFNAFHMPSKLNVNSNKKITKEVYLKKESNLNGKSKEQVFSEISQFIKEKI